jgi:hypothetical protein
MLQTTKGDEMDKKSLITDIMERELEMFLTVPSASPAPCQDNPDGFRTFRSVQFQSWSIETIQSYQNDLVKAKAENKNLMTLKYARMDNLIPLLHDKPHVYEIIKEIISISMEWQEEMLSKYPHFIYQGRPLDDKENNENITSFKRYLSGELETYSLLTLISLYRDMMDRKIKGQNMTEEIYSSLVANLGYASLEDAENTIKKQNTHN